MPPKPHKMAVPEPPAAIVTQPKKLSSDHRAKIGASLRQYHRQRLETVTEEPQRKKCSRCRKWKRVPKEFPMRKREAKCGIVREYPKGECKVCAAERSKAWREKQDGESLRRRRKKARRKHRRKYSVGHRVEAAPLGNFLEELVHRHGRSAVVLASGVDPSTVDKIRRGTYSHVELDVADRILTGLNYPEQFVTLYPQEENKDG